MKAFFRFSLFVVIAANNLYAQMSFVAEHVYGHTGGSSSSDLVTGDFNGDGKQDIITLNDFSKNISVFLNKGNGRLSTAVNYSTGKNGYFMAAGDVDGDGLPDIVVSHSETHQFSLLINKGEGAFDLPVSFSTGTFTTPRDIALADINSDGRPDVVTANETANTISVIINAGGKNFNAPLRYFTGSKPRDLAVGDLNNDRIPDIAVLNTVANSVSVLLNNPAGNLSPDVKYPTGTNSYGIIIEDIDNDSSNDLVVTYSSDESETSVHYNNGDGTFKPFAGLNLVHPLARAFPFDINSDGFMDFLSAEGSNMNGSLYVSLNQKNGSFAPPVRYKSGLGSHIISAADFNGDGFPDVAVGNNWSSSISVFMNKAGTGELLPEDYYLLEASTVSLTAADFNSDGELDVVLGNEYSYSLSVLYRKGGEFLDPQNYNMQSRSLTVSAGDVNGDGKSDVLVSNDGFYSPLLFLNGDTFGFGLRDTLLLYSFNGIISDLDNNGKGEILLATGMNELAVLKDSVPNTTSKPVRYKVGSRPKGIAAADLNGDGWKDVAVSNENDNNVSVLLSKADGTYENAVQYLTGKRPLSVAAGDVNGDNLNDIVTANYQDNTVSVLLNTGNGILQSQIVVNTGNKPRGVVVTNLDDDLAEEIATSDFGSNTVTVLKYTTDNAFTANNYFSGFQPGCIISGDFNKDGKTDLMVSNYEDQEVLFTTLLNTTILGYEEEVETNTRTLNFYPNPSAGSVSFHLKKAGTLRIYDQTGKECFSEAQSEGTKVVSLQHLDKGFYQVQFQTAEMLETFRLVLQ